MKVSVPGMPATLLNMSNNDIYKMVSGDKIDVKMNIFQRLWETLRHLFWSDKQPEAYTLLFNFVNNKVGNINASEYFTGAIDRMREKSLSIAWNYSINSKHAQKIRMRWSQRLICAGTLRSTVILS